MKWFNEERTRTVLTFPVETMALLTKDGDVLDKEYGDFTAEMYAEGHSFFTYMSDNADSLSSCCRLRNEIQDNGFSYTLGAGGVLYGFEERVDHQSEPLYTACCKIRYSLPFLPGRSSRLGSQSTALPIMRT